uniref:Uncharacterized protein n=1 Tax=Arundo donax TaxID=35708 RepID=A0A0A9H6V2_ARUDO
MIIQIVILISILEVFFCYAIAVQKYGKLPL